MGNKHGKMQDVEPKKRPLPTSKDGMLIVGFIRLTEQHIDSLYIPSTISQWIYRYYQSKSILYWTSPQQIYSVSIEKDDSKERVNELIEMDQCYCPAICYKSNVSIYNHTEPVNAIFKCGGIATDRSLLSNCNVTILSAPNIYREEEFVTNLDLPLLPQRMASNCLVFSNKYGLLSIGGFVGSYRNWNNLPRRYISNIYQLKLDSNEQELKWNELTQMKQSRGYSSAQIINTNEEKLMVIGGDLSTGNMYSNSCELYDFERKEWKYVQNMTHGRICSGIHYDADINWVYVGGGYCDSRVEKYSSFKKVEIYNCIKNKWYPFPDTQLKHAFYPYLWKHNNLLFIASAYSTGLEYIDLRCGMSWNTIYGEKNKKHSRIWHLFKKNHPNNNHNSGAICSGRLVG